MRRKSALPAVIAAAALAAAALAEGAAAAREGVLPPGDARWTARRTHLRSPG